MPAVMLSAAATGTDALSTAITSVASDMQGQIGAILPAALGVGGTILVCTLGWKLFKKFTKG